MEVIAGERERETSCISNSQLKFYNVSSQLKVDKKFGMFYHLYAERIRPVHETIFFKRLERKSAVSDVILSCLQNEGEMSTFNKS